jgi:hypothetical protein
VAVPEGPGTTFRRRAGALHRHDPPPEPEPGDGGGELGPDQHLGEQQQGDEQDGVGEGHGLERLDDRRDVADVAQQQPHHQAHQRERQDPARDEVARPRASPAELVGRLVGAGGARHPGRTTQRKPMCPVEVSTVSDWRAAGR